MLLSSMNTVIQGIIVADNIVGINSEWRLVNNVLSVGKE